MLKKQDSDEIDMDHFKYKQYEKSKTQLLNAYITNMVAYLRRQYPNIEVSQIISFVKKEIELKIQKPKLKLVTYSSYGNTELTDVDLLSYTETIQENIITPAGVLYMKPSKKESFIKKKINKNLKFRKIQKKKMLEAAAVGDLVTEQISNYLQASIKIETNSIPGAYGSPYNCLFDIPGYNGVTSTARHSIMCGYSHVEKLIAGNFYFPTLDHAINYCIQLCRVCPKNILEIVNKYNIFIPSVQDVCDHFLISMRHYMYTKSISSKFYKFIGSLSIPERIFVYYAYCLKTLFTRNEQLFKNFLNEFFKIDVPIEETAEPSSIYKLNSDLLAMTTALNSNLINQKPVSDAITECPNGIRKLIGIGKHMQECLDKTSDIWQTFFRIDVDVSDAMSHPNMIRKTVIISDTDSILFSTQRWIEWYTGKISFERSAYEINAFIVFLVVMTLEQVFARLSTNLGAEGDDIYKISMKNEFMYPLMLRTPLPKQYAGRVSIQEGFVLPKIKNDIKGLSFRSSTMCKQTIAAGNAFRDWIFDEVTANGTIKASDCIQKALDHEKTIIKSLELGEKTFLTTKPIRHSRDAYKDADASIFYYWELWDEVFKPIFGELIIPTKAYELPLLADGKILTEKSYLERVIAFDKNLHDRLLFFIENHKRPITAIYMPMTLKKIPLILRPVIDIRHVVFSNSTPFIVTLRSLGIGYTDSKNQTLLSDIYK